MDLDALLERLSADRFRALAGAAARVMLPLREAVVNGIIESAVLPSLPALRALTLVFHEGNRIDVLVASSRLWWMPSVTVSLEIEPDVVMQPSPMVRLRLLPTGIVGRLGPLAVPWKDALPKGVRLDNRTVEVDLQALLAGRDRWGLLTLLRQARVTTTASVMWVEATLDVPEPPPTDSSNIAVP
jgi:hypothetical protein